MTRAEVAHPLIAPFPAALDPLRGLARRLVIGALRAQWRHGHLAIALPGGAVVSLGDPTASERARVRVSDERALLRILLRGEMGGGEAFVAGEWSSPDLVAALRLLLRNSEARGFESRLTVAGRLPDLARHRRRANSRPGSARNIQAHYDLGNDFYQLFLDRSLSYSCALYDQPDATLEAAQQAKLDRLFRLLELGPRDRLLEIGCGWGGLAIHAARSRGCRVTAITVSRAQAELATARIAAAGLSDRIDLRFCDYRDVAAQPGLVPDGGFDKLVSVEMLEAVGHEFLPDFFATCGRLLRPGGRMALQTITMPDDRYDAYRRSVDWMQTYVFPGSLIPSLGAIGAAVAGSGLRIASVDDIGPDYARTLRAWRERFVANLPAVPALGFDAPFVRTWTMYLAFSEAAFAERTLGDAHILLGRGTS